MGLRTLKYFLAVVKYGSMSRAADVLFLSQPALSKQMQSLETEVGTKLFFRKKHRIELTLAGELLAKRAQEIIALEELTRNELAAEDYSVSGKLTIAMIDRIYSLKMSDLIESFSDSYPGVKISFICGCLDYINDIFRRGKADIYCSFFGKPPTNNRSVNTGHSRRLGFVMCRDNGLARFNSISEEQYKDNRIILPIGNLFGMEGDSFRIHPDENKVRARVQEPLNYMFMVKNDTCMYCLEPPEELLVRYKLTFRPLTPQTEAILMFASDQRKDLSEASAAFMDHAELFFSIYKELRTPLFDHQLG